MAKANANKLGWFAKHILRRKETIIPFEEIPVDKDDTLIKVSVDPKSPPQEQRRKYIADLLDGRTMEVERHNGYGEQRRSNIMLYDKQTEQSTYSRWLIIDIERVPYDLLNPDMVPLIKAYYREIIDLDDEWIKTGFTEFTDKLGNKWVKQAK